MGTSNFFHPSITFIMLAFVLPFLPGNRRWKWLLLLPPIAAVYSAFTNVAGIYMGFQWLGVDLTMGRVDALSMVFVQVFAIISLAGIIFSLHLNDKGQHVASLLYVAGGFGCVLAGDYLTLFAFWELMALGSTFLIMLNRSRESVLAGYRYFLYHIIGGLLLLAGILMRYFYTGSWLFESTLGDLTQTYNWLILAGFCVNAAVVPLHAWLPDAYPRGTVTGSVFMCAFTTKTAVYVLARAFAGWEVLAVAGVVMAVYGVVYASMENNARKILSYHIVSQVGYMVAGIGIGTALTLNGAVAHAYAHILYKGLLFMAVGALLYSTGTAKLDELGGLAGRLPWLVVLYMIAAFSISGMPLFNGFVSKTMTIYGAEEAHRLWLAFGLEVAAVGTFISVGLKLPYFAFWGAKPFASERTLKPIPVNMYLGMIILAALCFLQGIYPEILYRYLPNFDASLFNPWTAWSVLQSLLLLSFSGLAFYLMRKVIVPHKGINLDFDYFYRLLGRMIIALICKPLAWIDMIWSEIYKRIGISSLLSIAGISRFFDQKIIDGVVDGGAKTVYSLGNITSLTQNGRFQQYIGLAVIMFMAVFAILWFSGAFSQILNILTAYGK